MKVGIITILKVNNYGAELQAYATQAVMNALGYEAEIIDYLFYKNERFVKTHKAAPLFSFPIKKRLAEALYPVIARLKSRGNGEAAARRKRRFEEFHEKNTRLSPTYRSIDELYTSAREYDVYLTGSDQVWNPGIYASLEPYFLDFAPEGKRRVAYAASFGVSAIPDYAKAYYAKRLSAYSAIGVRESNAVEMVRELSGKEAQWVLDPTLLLSREQWLRVAAPSVEGGNYILIYELTPCGYIRELAEHISAARGWRIVRVCKGAATEDETGTIENVVDAGPAEFLGLFAGASAIVTNSFHGTAFAVNFRRPFYTVLPLRKRNNSRQRSLLEMFGLTSRLLLEGSDFPADDGLEIDFTEAGATLSRERERSINFLKEAIDGK